MPFLLDPFWFIHVTLKKEPYHYLRFEKESRYYELRLTQDLLEDWILITSNGRIKSKLGQSRTQAFNTFDDALTHFYAAVKLRFKRHYQIQSYLVENLIYTFLMLHLTSHSRVKSRDRIKTEKSTTNTSNKRKTRQKSHNSLQISFAF
ncbi:WGR domain-containing protein [Legionella sp. PATHC038]|uniref:WGR domain-containing protein n=1 Tax=Legionella sheltonii TaxID=2992041 RepID=UPI003A1024E7